RAERDERVRCTRGLGGLAQVISARVGRAALLLLWKPMLTKKCPHQTRCVDAPASGSDDPFQNRLAARPGVASSLDGIEHHGRVFSTVRVVETRDILSD